jgi:hypothetical protein
MQLARNLLPASCACCRMMLFLAVNLRVWVASVRRARAYNEAFAVAVTGDDCSSVDGAAQMAITADQRCPEDSR